MKYTVGQLAKIYNISAQTIHKYVDKGLIQCTRDKNGYRIFNNYNLQQLGTIIKYKNVGLSLKDTNFVYQNLHAEEILQKMQQSSFELEKQLKKSQLRHAQMIEDVQLMNNYINTENDFVVEEKKCMYRLDICDINLGEEVNGELLKDEVLTKTLSNWYEHLFHVKSSLKFNYNDFQIKNYNVGAIANYDFYKENIKEKNEKAKKITGGLFARKTMSYENHVNTQKIEEEINNFFLHNPNYKLRHEPITRLIISYKNKCNDKINVFELLLPIRIRIQ